MSATGKSKRLVWVLAAGRCIICNKHLASDHLGTGRAVRAIGEVAHVAGESEEGPRGDSSVPIGDRNDPENLLLLCPSEHTEADSGRLRDPLYTEEFLQARKQSKEAWIRFVTGLDADRTTTVLRLSGEVRGSTSLITQHEAASVVMADTLRTPRYLADPRGVGLTIDISEVPDPGTAEYWSACLRQMDKAVERLRRAAQEGETSHVSVFAFGLIPLLVALGNALDDTMPLAVYERHRSSESWNWDVEAEAHQFSYELADNIDKGGRAVLVVNASGTIKPDELPFHVADLPIITLRPEGGHTPGPSTFASKTTLDRFAQTLRQLIAQLEGYKNIDHVHVFLAAPVSATVTFGRCWPVDNAAPSMTIYHRAHNAYLAAVNLPRSLGAPIQQSNTLEQ